MLITNGKVIVPVDMDKESFISLMENLTERAKEHFDNSEIAFPFAEEPYVHCKNEHGLSFSDLRYIVDDDAEVLFKAIGDESVQLPGTRVKTVQHYYTPEEKAQIANEIATSQQEKEGVERERKEIAKQYKDKYDSLESRISEDSKKYRMGYEDRDEECFVIFDFEEDTKQFIHKDTSEVLETEPLDPEDYQMRIDMSSGFIPEINSNQGNEDDPEAMEEENSGEQENEL